MKLTNLLIFLALSSATLQQAAPGGEAGGNNGPLDNFKLCEGTKTWRGPKDDTCVQCRDAPHGANCALCSPASANCFLCNAGFANPSVAGALCTNCTQNFPGCAECIAQYNPLEQGCKACAGGFVKYKKEHKYHCTNCEENKDQCADCGGKNANNCLTCDRDKGCTQCAGNWDFNPETKVWNLFTFYGECTVCKQGYKIGQSGQCDECADGFNLVDGICVETMAAVCGGNPIEGCRVCGTTDNTKCGQCSTGYGLGQVGESTTCVKCERKGCHTCDFAPLPQGQGQGGQTQGGQTQGGDQQTTQGDGGQGATPAGKNTCSKCVPNRWQFTQNYCLGSSVLGFLGVFVATAIGYFYGFM